MWCSVQVRYFEAKKTEHKSDRTKGPAHAVYFATYEVVKQAMGGNAAGHHPVAAGTSYRTSRPVLKTNTQHQQRAEPAQQSPATPS